MQRRELVNLLLLRRDNDVLIEVADRHINIQEVTYQPAADMIIIKLQPKEINELLTFVGQEAAIGRRELAANR